MNLPKLLILGLLYVNIGRPQDVLTFLKPLSLGLVFGGLTLVYILLNKKGLERETDGKPPENKALLWVLVWACISIPFSIHKGYSVQTMIGIFKGLILYLGLYYCFRTEDDFLLVGRTLLISILTLSLSGLFSGASAERSSVGSFYDPNDLALVLTSCIPFINYHLRERNAIVKFLAVIAALATLIQIVSTQSRMGFLLLILAALLVILQNRSSVLGMVKGFFITGVFAVFFMSVVTPEYLKRIETIFSKESTGSGRTYIWKRGLEMANANPVFGVGLGAFRSAYGRLLMDGRFESVEDRKFNVAWKVAHNSYVKVLAETGYPGLVLYLLLLRKVVGNLRGVKSWFRDRDDGGVLAKVNTVEGSLYLLLVGSFFLDQELNAFFFTLMFLGVLLGRLQHRELAGEAAEAGDMLQATPVLQNAVHSGFRQVSS